LLIATPAPALEMSLRCNNRWLYETNFSTTVLPFDHAFEACFDFSLRTFFAFNANFHPTFSFVCQVKLSLKEGV
jgi:hypothetical protein